MRVVPTAHRTSSSLDAPKIARLITGVAPAIVPALGMSVLVGSNAIKFTDEGSVRFGVVQRPEGDRRLTRFAVIDTGCGIAREDQERLFLAFEQIARADGTRTEGTGLGLHLSQTLAAVIGGEITVESALGSGSTFGLQFSQRES